MSLPTYGSLGAVPPPDVVPSQIAHDWLEAFDDAISASNIQAVTYLFLEDGWWRDLLSMTWDYRTFNGRERIAKFLDDRLQVSGLSAFKLSDAAPTKFISPYPDLGWIQAIFTFRTTVGSGRGVLRLVYLPSGDWKAFTLVTTLESLDDAAIEIDFDYPGREDYAATRHKEQEFLHDSPTVLIVGAGQSGLGLAARLKILGVSSLIIEKTPRVGDQWRTVRYASLRVHDPMWRDQLPLFNMPEPPLWPFFTPGTKIGDWFESYAKLLDLTVWTSSTIKDGKYDKTNKEWTVTVVRGDGSLRVLQTKHIVWATGMAGGVPNMPSYPGMRDFKGQILHATQFSRPSEFKGKRVVVIGSGVSGHDICGDLAHEGVDVTMIQRGSTYVMSVKNAIPIQWKELYWKGSPPTEVADLLYLSVPHLVSMPLSKRFTAKVAEMDKDMLDGLARVGFRTNMGIDGTGLFRLALERFGGSYINVGASEMIISGQIKLKNDSHIQSLTADGIKFEDGSLLPADVVICATGYGHMHDSIEKVFGQEVRGVLKDKFWGLDKEGEVNGMWRDSGHERFYVTYGNFPTARFFSKFLALQIKAMEMGILGERYSIDSSE